MKEEFAYETSMNESLKKKNRRENDFILQDTKQQQNNFTYENLIKRNTGTFMAAAANYSSYTRNLSNFNFH